MQPNCIIIYQITPMSIFSWSYYIFVSNIKFRCNKRRLQTTSTSEESLDKNDSEVTGPSDTSRQPSNAEVRDLQPQTATSNLAAVSLPQQNTITVSVAHTAYPKSILSSSVQHHSSPQSHGSHQPYQQNILPYHQPVLPPLSLEKRNLPNLLTSAESSTLSKHLLSQSSHKGSSSKLSTPPDYACNMQSYAYNQKADVQQLGLASGKITKSFPTNET